MPVLKSKNGKQSTLKSQLKGLKLVEQKEPLWKGPAVDGITQSMLNRFIACKERFRIAYIDGLQPPDTFNVRLEYGQMWHTCEEAHAGNKDWEVALKGYTKGLVTKYRLSQDKVVHWYEICKMQYPIYIKHWEKNADVKNRVPIFQEVSFEVPYTLPSGKVVKLRGKWDSVDHIGRGKAPPIYLQENKTKGEMDEQQIREQLKFDMQTMIYLVALQEAGHNPSGVRYNVIRRPLAGGKHSIRPHKVTKSKRAETMPEFYDRLAERITEDAGFFFMRWKVEVSASDIVKFKKTFLNPILEHLCRWYEVVTHPELEDTEGVHWRTPYGIYNPLARGASTEYDSYLEDGIPTGLQRADKLFREL